jgi:hypothetical protein
MAGQKAASLSPEMQALAVEVEQMNLFEVQKIFRDCMRGIVPGKITVKETSALVRAANKRVTAIKRELRRADEARTRKLLGPSASSARARGFNRFRSKMRPPEQGG